MRNSQDPLNHCNQINQIEKRTWPGLKEIVVGIKDTGSVGEDRTAD